MEMHTNPDELVKSYRQRRATLEPAKAWDTNNDHPPTNEDEEGFVNPGPDQPVPTAEHLAHADLSFLRPAVLAAYDEPDDPAYDPIALVKAAWFKPLRQDLTSWTRLGHYLALHPKTPWPWALSATRPGSLRPRAGSGSTTPPTTWGTSATNASTRH
jgi:hypothetical protein